MTIILENNSIEISKMKNNIYNIKILKSSPNKKDMKEYHQKIYEIYDENEDLNKKFSLIFDLTVCGIWSVGIASREFNFLDKLGERSIKSVNSIAIVSGSYIWKIINYFISESKKKVPYKLCKTFEKAMEYINQQIR